MRTSRRNLLVLTTLTVVSTRRIPNVDETGSENAVPEVFFSGSAMAVSRPRVAKPTSVLL